MGDPESKSKAGNPIERHEAPAREFQLAPGSSDGLDAITKHIQRHIGPIAMVWHEMVSDLVHIDVHHVPPSDERPFHTFVTSGMSDRPMTVPEGAEEFRYAELLIALPSDWPLTPEDWKKEVHFWPIQWVKFLARLPHEYKTWLGFLHTVPNGDPAEPFSSETKLCGGIILPPVSFPREFRTLVISPEKTVNFYAVVPLYAEEIQLKLDQGSDALLDAIDRIGISEVVDCKRPCAVQA